MASAGSQHPVLLSTYPPHPTSHSLWSSVPDPRRYEPPDSNPQQPDPILVLLPLLIVLSTFLFLLLIFLVCVLLIRRRRGIVLRDSDGPIDMSREELIDSDGGFEGIESRWLESVDENVRRAYTRAKEYQSQYPPNSLPTDITLSQFLSIQEKGVSAWCFEPDYETINSLLVHARTEITFLPDPASSSCVQSNLPLPKLNEVYYWEIKMFDLPETTTVSVGLATKPYPPFQLPGHNRYSVAYHSNGDKSHNYPFTSSAFGPRLKEGDVLGIGYRPRTGTVFFTRNGRKMEDAYMGLSRYNLFPTVGADGPCSVHVNLGQSGFVFIEANVKKWGLAPSVGTLAPPPAYGSERGSILLDVGGRVRPHTESSPPSSTPGASSPTSRPRRVRRSRPPSVTGVSSPLRSSVLVEALTPPPPITPIDEEPHDGETNYADRPPPTPEVPSAVVPEEDRQTIPVPGSPTTSTRSLSPNAGARNPFIPPRPHRRSLTHAATSLSQSGSELTVTLHPPPESPLSPNPNPPTPNERDIHLRAFSRVNSHRRTSSGASHHSSMDDDDEEQPLLQDRATLARRDPPAYSPLDAYRYAEGVQLDLPADVISAALESGAITTNNMPSSSDRRRSRRR